MKSVWRLMASLLLVIFLAGCTDLTVPPKAEHTLPLAEAPGTLLFDFRTHVVLVTAGQEREVALPARFTDYIASPDGRFLTGLKDGSNLVTFSLHGDKTWQLAEAKSPATWQWSPDGQYLAVVDRGAKEKTALLLIYSWNGFPKQVIPLGPGVGRKIAWAPDAKRLAITVSESIQEGEASLWLVDWESGSATLQAEEAWTVPTSWSPDGQRLLYAVTDKTLGAKLLLLAPDGQLSTVISTDSIGPRLPHLADRFRTHVLQVYQTFWSPNGDAIYLSFKSASRDPRFGLFKVAADGTMADWVLPVYPELSPPEIRPARACTPASPHLVTGGSRIASMVYGPGCDGTLAILNAVTLQEEAKLTVPTEARLMPSPDGDWLAVYGPDHTDLITLQNGVLMRVKLDLPGPMLAWIQ